MLEVISHEVVPADQVLLKSEGGRPFFTLIWHGMTQTPLLSNSQMIGSSFVCPMSGIEVICSNALFIEDFATHPQQQPRLFVTMCLVLVNAPTPKKRGRRIM